MHIFKPLAVVFAVCVAGELLSSCIGGFLPGNVLGMVVMLVLLLSGRLEEERVRLVTDFFEHNMPIFFLPTCLGILDLSSQVREVLVPIVVVVVASTLLTAAATALTVHLVSRWQRRRGETDPC